MLSSEINGPVTLLKHGDIAVITIDNPPVNALSQAVRQGLVNCLKQAELDSEVNAIVISCDGRTFIAGADISEFGKTPLEPHLPDVLAKLDQCTKPLVAALFGTVLGVIKAFSELGDDLAGAGGGLMTGISEALVATGVGLMVAIPAVVAYNIFVAKVNRLAANTSLLSKTLLAQLKAVPRTSTAGV